MRYRSLQLGHILALYRTTRGNGRLVADQPSAEADQDRSPRRPPRPRHHLSTGRGARHRPDSARHPCRDPPPSSATVMRMNGIRIQTERKPQDRSVRRDEKRRHLARKRRVRGPIRPAPGVCATADVARGEKRLFNCRNQAILTSDGRPLGECRLKVAASVLESTNFNPSL